MCTGRTLGTLAGLVALACATESGEGQNAIERTGSSGGTAAQDGATGGGAAEVPEAGPQVSLDYDRSPGNPVLVFWEGGGFFSPPGITPSFVLFGDGSLFFNRARRGVTLSGFEASRLDAASVGSLLERARDLGLLVRSTNQTSTVVDPDTSVLKIAVRERCVTHRVYPSPPAGAHEPFVASLFAEVIAALPAESLTFERVRLSYSVYRPLAECDSAILPVAEMAQWDLPGAAAPRAEVQCLEGTEADVAALQGGVDPRYFWGFPTQGSPPTAVLKTATDCVRMRVDRLFPGEVACMDGAPAGAQVPTDLRDCPIETP